MKKTLSIIIPVYNSETTIGRCIESIFQNESNFNEIEVILINDGSTDNSLIICQEYQNRYGRNNIKIVNKENTGPSDSRNKGLMLAKGEYVSFVDSDDYVEKNYIEVLLYEINFNKKDIIFIPNNFVDCNGKIFYKNDVSNMSNDMEKRELIYKIIKSDFFGYSSSKCISRKLILDNNIRMRKDIRICEDLLFTCDATRVSDNIGILSKHIYNYVTYSSSLSNSYRKEMKYEYEYVNEEYFNFLIGEKIKNYEDIICEKSVQTIINYLKLFKFYNIKGKELNYECKWLLNTYTYNELLKYLDNYSKLIKGKKKIPLIIALKCKSIILFKMLIKLV